MPLLPFLLLAAFAQAAPPTPVDPAPGSTITLIGGGQGERLLHHPDFEVELQRRFAGRDLAFRNLCDDGDTPAYRDHSGRNSPFAFPGADKFRQLSGTKDKWGSGHAGSGFAWVPDQWLVEIDTDILLAWFGYSESFDGPAGLARFRDELGAWLDHTASQRYNNKSAPRVVLITPLALEEDVAPQGPDAARAANANLAAVARVIREAGAARGLLVADLHAFSLAAYRDSAAPLTSDGLRWTPAAHALLAKALADGAFVPGSPRGDRAAVARAVADKDWHWERLFKVPNGVHVHGRRHQPFGPQNYPAELRKLAEMVRNRDQAIWAAAAGRPFDLPGADARTSPLPVIKTNYTPSNAKNGRPEYLPGAQSLRALTLAPGYKAELFASEETFPDLANPVRLSFDSRGRLWVATMPSYPHWRPGDPRPDDKILILEDTNRDGRADRQTVFARGLHLPLSFEFAPEGVYVPQGGHLVLLRDTDGDSRVDRSEIVLSGFDDHDTHHAISAFRADPSGAFYMAEGTFLHSHVETPRGVERSTNGGFFRYSPQRRHLERAARLSIPNPWGFALDAHGQEFFADTSDPAVRWLAPAALRAPFGEFAPLPPDLVPQAHRVRPTAGLEFVSSRHFPDDVQGDLLVGNTIGFLGAKQHALSEDGTGFRLAFRHDLLRSSDGNFRPVSMEFAPDGSLYLADWHNALIGHMQHSARDPLRDKTHGRIFRVTYPARPLLTPPAIAGAPVDTLLANLTLHEDRARSRSRLELRSRPADEVAAALRRWPSSLNPADPLLERHLLEALWVGWSIERLDPDLLRRLLQAKDHRVRAAAVRVLRHNAATLPDHLALLLRAAADPHGRVRLEAATSSTWLGKDIAAQVLAEARRHPIDGWIRPALDAADAFQSGGAFREPEPAAPVTTLAGDAKRLFQLGAEVYRREGHCATCHQPDGLGLPAAQFPPLAKSEWVTGSPERLIRLTLHGLMGPITVNGVDYPGQVPMTAFKMLPDEEIAAVLTYVRNSFGNQAPPITPAQVAKERAATKDQQGFLSPADLLREFPNK